MALPAGYRSDEQLDAWLQKGADVAMSLPPK